MSNRRRGLIIDNFAGNSVCPPVARAILEANFANQATRVGRAVA